MEPLPMIGSYVPDDTDRLTHSLAVAVLRSDRRRVDDCIEGLEAIDATRRERDEPPTGMLPYALDARNAALDDTLSYRRAADALLRRKDLDPALRARVRQEVADDPLRLADARLHDARVRRIGRAVNAFSAALGRSAITGIMLPIRLLQSIVGVAVAEHQDDELTPPERQALAHWKRFIEKEPNTPEASVLLERVDAAQVRWFRTQRDRNLRGARKALEGNDAPLAFALSERALRYAPEDREATRLLREAEERRSLWSENRARSVEASDADSTEQRELAVALLLPDGPIQETATALLERNPDTALADEAAFALATLLGEAGRETPMWDRLEEITDLGDERSNMARHARAAVSSAEQNPYRAFRAARRAQTWTMLRWLFFGPLANGARERDLARPLEWAIEIPTLVNVVGGFPNRLIRFPFMRPTSRAPSVLARRYLERYPYGEHAASVRRWLEDFEASRGNHFGALQLAESQPETDPRHLEELRRKAAEQALEAASREKRRDVRLSLLKKIAREFQGTEAGRKAGERAREEVLESTPQRIQVTRAFLRQRRAASRGHHLPGRTDAAVRVRERERQRARFPQENRYRGLRGAAGAGGSAARGDLATDRPGRPRRARRVRRRPGPLLRAREARCDRDSRSACFGRVDLRLPGNAREVRPGPLPGVDPPRRDRASGELRRFQPRRLPTRPDAQAHRRRHALPLSGDVVERSTSRAYPRS
jgi:hypothetical protein